MEEQSPTALELQLERVVFKNQFDSLWSMRIARAFTDVTFMVNGVTFHVHKVILIAQCEYFRNFFSSNACLPYSDVYNVSGVTSRVFHHFLEVLYGITPSVEDWREMIDLCHYIFNMGIDPLTVDVLIMKMLRTVCPTLSTSVFPELCRKVASVYELHSASIPEYITPALYVKLDNPINLTKIVGLHYVKRILLAYLTRFDDIDMTYEMVHLCVEDGMHMSLYDIIAFNKLPIKERLLEDKSLNQRHCYHYPTADRYLKHSLIADIKSKTPISTYVVKEGDFNRVGIARKYKYMYNVSTKYGEFDLFSTIMLDVNASTALTLTSENWARRHIFY